MILNLFFKNKASFGNLVTKNKLKILKDLRKKQYQHSSTLDLVFYKYSNFYKYWDWFLST